MQLEGEPPSLKQPLTGALFEAPRVSLVCTSIMIILKFNGASVLFIPEPLNFKYRLAGLTWLLLASLKREAGGCSAR